MSIDLIDILNILAGLVLCVSFLDAVPTLQKFAKWLGSFDTIIGIILIIIDFSKWTHHYLFRIKNVL